MISEFVYMKCIQRLDPECDIKVREDRQMIPAGDIPNNIIRSYFHSYIGGFILS